MRNNKKIIRTCTVPLSLDFFEEVSEKMVVDGYEVVVVTSPGPELEAFKLRAESLELREGLKPIRCIEVPMERHISLWKDGVALLRMIWVFWKERPYMVHSMTPKAGLLTMVAGWLTGVPVRIHTFTGLVWPTAVGGKRKVLMLMDRLLCACATHIIPEGQGVLNDLRDNGVCKKPMKVLGYGNCKGVDMVRLDPMRFVDLDKNCGETPITGPGPSVEKSVENPFTYLFVGRVVGDKGINELVEAFTRLHDKYSNTKLRLVGWIEKELDPVSELTQQRIDANDAIEVPGPMFGDELLKEYVMADCHVMPSYREGFPNTVLEAGAMGLPQIVTDINGSREIIISSGSKQQAAVQGSMQQSCGSKGNLNSVALNSCDSNIEQAKPLNQSKMKICDNGIIVQPRDAKALYDAMERMLVDKEMYERLSANARPMIESRFEKNFVQRCLMEFYQEIMV